MTTSYVRHALPASIAFVLAAGLVAAFVSAGPLDPPAGPVTGTFKTLAEVEPRIAVNAVNTPGNANSLFRITQPGSYYLAGNLIGVPGKRGVEIACSGVTLDLNGFDLVGLPQTSEQDGVKVVSAGVSNVVVFNGSVRNWSGVGVHLRQPAVTNCRVERVTASGNTRYGIVVNNGSAVVDCAASSNSDYGILLGDGCLASRCTAFSNAVSGIGSGSGCTIVSCNARDNQIGIGTNAHSSIIDCTSSNNTDVGISSVDFCTISRCNVFSTTGLGITTRNGSAIVDCSSNGNTGVGILVGSDCRVANCSALENSEAGVRADSRCVIEGNACAAASIGIAAIHITGGGSRIDRNNSTNSPRGIKVDSAGNVIVRNTCSGNSVDWVIAANNVVGPILDRRAPAVAAISGFSAPGSLGSTEPNANFSY